MAEIRIKSEWIIVPIFAIFLFAIVLILLYLTDIELVSMSSKIMFFVYTFINTVAFYKYILVVNRDKFLTSEIRKWRSLAQDKSGDIHTILKWCKENKIELPDYLLRELEIYDGNWKSKYPASPSRSFKH